MREKEFQPASVLLRIGSTYLLLPRSAADSAADIIEHAAVMAAGYVEGIGEVFYPSPYLHETPDVQIKRITTYPSYDAYNEASKLATEKAKAEREARAAARAQEEESK